VKFIDLRRAAALGLLAVLYLLTRPFVPGDPSGRAAAQGATQPAEPAATNNATTWCGCTAAAI
jgi:hypothetical protein